MTGGSEHGGRARSRKGWRYLAASLVGISALAALPGIAAGSAKARTTGTKASGSKLKACFMVSNLGIDDHGFNEEGWTALEEAKKAYGATITYLEETGSVTYSTIGSEFVSEGCNFIVGEGFDTADEIETLATQYPSDKFALIDDTLGKSYPNVAQIYFATDEPSFVAGYVSAAMSKSKVIGMYGNEAIPPVLTYLNGFYAGVEYYDKLNHANVKAIGYNPVTHAGEFMGSFTSTTAATQITDSELSQGADIIYPVGLPNTAAEAVQKYGKGTAAIGVDTDGCTSYPSLCSAFLTSVEKNITTTLFRVITSDVKGDFAKGVFRGTMRNGGVGIAPFHDWASKVPSKVATMAKTLEKEIAQGKINYDPYKA